MTLLTPEQQKTERLRSMARTFERADTTLARRKVTVKVEASNIPAPGFSIGDEITLNSKHIGSTDTTDDIINITGLNFHELSHAEYTPRGRDNTNVAGYRGKKTMHYFNILEDQRIESLTAAKYPSLRPYFVMTIMKYLLDGDITTVHPLTHGRKFLPLQVRQEVRAQFKHQDILTELDAVIDEYRRVSYPRDADRAHQLVVRFGELLASTNVTHGDPYGHDSTQRQASDGGGPRSQQDASPDQQDASPDQQEAQDQLAEEETKGEGSEDYAPREDTNTSDESEQDDDDDQGDSSGSDADGDDQGDGEDGAGDGDGDGGDGDGTGAESDGDGNGKADAGTGDGGPGQGGGADGEGEGDAGDAGEGSGTDAGTSGSGNPTLTPDELRDVIEQVLRNAKNDPVVQQDAKTKRAAMNKISGQIPSLETAHYEEQAIPAEVTTVSNRFKRELSKLMADADPGWNKHKASGRINVQRAMRGGELDTLFDQWDEGRNDANDIEMVILIDFSSSMHAPQMKASSQYLWAIKRAVESIGGEVTVIGFNVGALTFYDKMAKAKRGLYRSFGSNGGTDPNDALDQTRMIMHYSKKAHKIVLFLTDGKWGSIFGTKVADQADATIQQLHVHGITTGLAFLRNHMQDHLKEDTLTDEQRQEFFHGCNSSVIIDTPSHLVTLAKSLVKHAMTN